MHFFPRCTRPCIVSHSESLSTFATSQTKRGWLEKRNCSDQSLEMHAFKWIHQNSNDWLNTVTWNTVNAQISARCACPIIWVEREKRECAYFKGEVWGGRRLFLFFRIWGLKMILCFERTKPLTLNQKNWDVPFDRNSNMCTCVCLTYISLSTCCSVSI